MSAVQDGDEEQSKNSLYAAMARTATRGVALYFSRPVRLFRPSKVSGWQILKRLATQHGESLSPQYVSGLIRQQGFMVIPKHFIPPMMVNLILGSVLWSTYSEASGFLSHHISSPLCVAALSGSIAGGMQALIAAPAENVRFALEGGSPATGWSHAWKEVFRGTGNQSYTPKEAQIHEAREVRQWMKEVGEMAGRGWDGWGWGFAKDVCGFSVFFSIFELTRRGAAHAKSLSETFLNDAGRDDARALHSHTPRVVHALTLVAGGATAGLAYEVTSRPWDIARKTVHIDRITSAAEHHSITLLLLRKIQHDGLGSFFVNPAHGTHDASLTPLRRRANSMLRTMARVGPWGVGFLVWEAFGPGIS